MTALAVTLLLAAAVNLTWLAVELIRRQRRWIREQRRILAMQEQIAANIARPRTGNVSHLGSRRP